MNLTRYFLASLIAMSPLACGTPPASNESFTLELRGVADDGSPLAGVSFSGSKPWGVTGKDGRLTQRLAAPESAAIAITATCPPDYKDAPRLPPVRLTKTRRIDDHRTQAIPVEVRCERRESELLVVVRAERGGRLPVVVDGQPLVSTDDDGIAHVLLRRPRAAGTVEVSLDTSSRPELKPRSPSRTYQVGGADTVLLVDQAFVPQSQAVARSVSPRRHIPVRVD
jgi:hypothetical protein